MSEMQTREQWLEALTESVRPVFANIGLPLPERVHVSCGWPSKSALGKKSRRIGECWPRSMSEEGVNEVFISPLLDEPLEVAHVLVHELIHAADDCEHGHKGPFVSAMKALSLGGKPTSTERTPLFDTWVEPLLPGPYPHKAVKLPGDRKKQTTRMLKAVCRSCEWEDEPYIVRLSLTTADRGMPICPIHEEPMELDLPEDLPV